MASDAGTELDEARFGRAFRYGVAFGLPIAFVIISAISLIAGVSFGLALLVAVWPALVAGPFFGTVIAVGVLTRSTGEPAPGAVEHLPTAVTTHRKAA